MEEVSKFLSKKKVLFANLDFYPLSPLCPFSLVIFLTSERIFIGISENETLIRKGVFH
jgi:hypothetical protein